MVNLTILNILFIGLFISLVKLIYEEMKVKLNQKASRIILASKLNIKEMYYLPCFTTLQGGFPNKGKLLIVVSSIGSLIC